MAYQVYYIPNGPANLESIFPDVDWSQVARYLVSALSGGDIIAQSTVNNLLGECCEDKIRIHFRNYLGTIDAINSKEVTDEFEAKSDQWQRGLPFPLVMSQHGVNRFNVKANNVITVEVTDYPQEDNQWINELISTSLAWIEFQPFDAVDPDYMPIIVQDIKILDVTENDRFENVLRLQITYSHPKFIIRN